MTFLLAVTTHLPFHRASWMMDSATGEPVSSTTMSTLGSETTRRQAGAPGLKPEEGSSGS